MFEKDPDSIIRITKMALDITMLSEREEGFKRAVDAITELGNCNECAEMIRSFILEHKEEILK